MGFHSSDEYEKEGRDHYNLGEFDAALATFKEGLSRFPDDPDLLLGRAMSHIRLGDYVQACGLLEGMRKKNPHWGDVLQGLAEANLWLGKKKEAIDCIEAATEGSEIEPSAVNGMALLLYEHDQFEEAAVYYRKAAALDSEYAPAHLGLGVCMHRLKRTQEAVAAIGRAIRSDPNYWEAYSYLGNILFDLKKRREAKAILDKIPVSELWDPVTLRRLIRMSWRKTDADRRKALLTRQKELEKLRQSSDLDDFLDELGGRVDQASLKAHPRSEGRFWTGDPSKAPNIGLRINEMLSRMFSAPCAFDGTQRPRLIRFDRGLCEEYLVCLAKFLDEERWWIRHYKASKNRIKLHNALEASGAAGLLFYGAEIIREMRRRYKDKIISSAVIGKLQLSLKRFEPYAQTGSRAKEAWDKVTLALTLEGA